VTEGEVLQFQNSPATESAGNSRDDGTCILKHAQNTMAADPPPGTLDFFVVFGLFSRDSPDLLLAAEDAVAARTPAADDQLLHLS
jgi:hypothetical protein